MSLNFARSNGIDPKTANPLQHKLFANRSEKRLHCRLRNAFQCGRNPHRAVVFVNEQSADTLAEVLVPNYVLRTPNNAMNQTP